MSTDLGPQDDLNKASSKATEPVPKPKPEVTVNTPENAYPLFMKNPEKAIKDDQIRHHFRKWQFACNVCVIGSIASKTPGERG